MVDGRTLRYAGRREQLLDGAATWLVENGLGRMSIRAVAADLGISHRTLLHHFPTRQQLLAEALGVLRRRSMTVLNAQMLEADDAEPGSLIGSMWEHFTAPDTLPYHRVFFEVCGAALAEPDQYRPFLDGFETDWVEAIEAPLRRASIPDEQVAPIATLIVATYRGLLLDVLITGERGHTGGALEELAGLVRSASVAATG
jgi:AcrR family transcriptional regulator